MNLVDTSHIRLCSARWHTHLVECERCFKSYYASQPGMCEAGKVLFDEYVSAIEAHRNCEHLTATEAVCETTTTP